MITITPQTTIVSGGQYTSEFDRISAKDSDGLKLTNDAHQLGIFIQDNGQVGINTVAPSADFHVNGTSRFTDTLNVDSNIVIADGGTIGQAAGPLIAFDDTNNYLEITGANVGIGTTSPGATLDVHGVIQSNNSYELSKSEGAYYKALGDGVSVWFGVSAGGRGFLGTLNDYDLDLRGDSCDF